jgi:hypothetical protein
MECSFDQLSGLETLPTRERIACIAMLTSTLCAQIAVHRCRIADVIGLRAGSRFALRTVPEPGR